MEVLDFLLRTIGGHTTGVYQLVHLLAQWGQILGVVSQLALRQNGPRIRLIVRFPPSLHQNF